MERAFARRKAVETTLTLIGVVVGYVLGGGAFEWWDYRRQTRWTDEDVALFKEMVVAAQEFHKAIHG